MKLLVSVAGTFRRSGTWLVPTPVEPMMTVPFVLLDALRSVKEKGAVRVAVSTPAKVYSWPVAVSVPVACAAEPVIWSSDVAMLPQVQAETLLAGVPQSIAWLPDGAVDDGCRK